MRRKCFSVSSQAEATQRSTMAESRQRLTLWVRRRTPLWGLRVRCDRDCWRCDQGIRYRERRIMAEAQGPSETFGTRDNMSLRARLEYYPGYYAADIFDPDGYSFEVVHKS